ncbi:hypothetical protein KR009_008113, partial [Drosophila setifemur]
SNAFKRMLDERIFTDCRITVGTKVFHCHKMILGVASEFFERSFLSDFKEAASGELSLPNIEPETFDQFLQYVYTYDKGILETYDELALAKLMQCADMWLVPSLQAACNKLILKKMDFMNISSLLVYFEYVHDVNNESLIASVSIYLNKFSGHNFPDEVYQLGSDAFRKLITIIERDSPKRKLYDMLEKYLEINGFILNEQEPKKYEFKWPSNGTEASPDGCNVNPNPFELKPSRLSGPSQDSKSKAINLQYVKELFNLIDYTKMTIQEFYEGPGKSKVFSFEEKYYFLYRIA